MDYENLLELVKNRRSIRRFKPDPIPDEVIEKIIEVARWAPSGFNMQPWEFVVIKDGDLKDKIVGAINFYLSQIQMWSKRSAGPYGSEESRSDDEIKNFIIRATSWYIGTYRRKPDMIDQ